jgi:hypothetical protein
VKGFSRIPDAVGFADFVVSLPRHQRSNQMRQVVRKTEFPGKPRRYSRSETEFPQRRCLIGQGVTMLPLSRPSKAVDMPDQGSYAGRAQTVHCSMRPRQAFARQNGVDQILSPPGAAVAASAAPAILAGDASARAQQQPREASLAPPQAAIPPLGTRAESAMPRRRRPITALRCAAIRATTSSWPHFLAVLANGEIEEGEARRARSAGR